MFKPNDRVKLKQPYRNLPVERIGVVVATRKPLKTRLRWDGVASVSIYYTAMLEKVVATVSVVCDNNEYGKDRRTT